MLKLKLICLHINDCEDTNLERLRRNITIQLLEVEMIGILEMSIIDNINEIRRLTK